MGIELHNMDCMEYMKGLPDKSFDICVTSPPYNANMRVNSKKTGYVSRQAVEKDDGRFKSMKYLSGGDNLPMDDYEEFLCDSADEMLRVSKVVFLNIQMITGNKPALFRFIGRFSEQIKEIIIWDKIKGQPAMCEGVLNSCFELIIVLGDEPILRAFSSSSFERGTVDNIFRIPSARSFVKNHKASFPLALSDEIFYNFSSSGQSAFDPFLGTGTTAISSHFRGLDFTGCEIDKGYFDAAKERIDTETSQEDMFCV